MTSWTPVSLMSALEILPYSLTMSSSFSAVSFLIPLAMSTPPTPPCGVVISPHAMTSPRAISLSLPPSFPLSLSSLSSLPPSLPFPSFIFYPFILLFHVVFLFILVEYVLPLELVPDPLCLSPLPLPSLPPFLPLHPSPFLPLSFILLSFYPFISSCFLACTG